MEPPLLFTGVGDRTDNNVDCDAQILFFFDDFFQACQELRDV